MNGIHWHGSIENVLMYGISAIIVINLTRLSAAWLEQRGGTVGTVGKSIGALV